MNCSRNNLKLGGGHVTHRRGGSFPISRSGKVSHNDLRYDLVRRERERKGGPGFGAGAEGDFQVFFCTRMLTK